MLRPGIAPSYIYETVMKDIDESSLPISWDSGTGGSNSSVMGSGCTMNCLCWQRVSMSAAGRDGLCGGTQSRVEGVGMVGIENTFIVTPEGGRCITGSHPGLMEVY